MHLQLLRRLWSYRRDVAGAAVYWSGVGRVFEIAARPAGAVILMYHSVARTEAAKFIDPSNRISPEMFEQQMAFLSKHRRVVTISQVVEEIASGASPPVGTVCITFDDGYLDNLTVAAPILEKHRLPATLYLPTSYIEHGEPQWADVLYWLLRYRTSNRLSIPSVGLDEANLASRAGRAAARGVLHSRLLESSLDNRTRLLGEMRRQLNPVGNAPRLTMSWDDVRELTRRYSFFEIGGHTRDHVDLRTHRGDTARSQVRECADDLRRELGAEPGHFSFPYARWCAETRDIVRAFGWRSAVGMGDGIRITATSDRFAMPRIEAPRNMTELRFKTSGANPGALTMLGLN